MRQGKQSQAVIAFVACPTCHRRQGQYCIYRTGPCERIGKATKECHPERIAKALLPWKLWDGKD